MIQTKHININIIGESDSKEALVVCSWNGNFVHKTLVEYFSSKVTVIQLTEVQGGIHDNVEVLMLLTELFSRHSRLVFVGCSRAGHSALWLASQSYGKAINAAIAVVPQANYFSEEKYSQLSGFKIPSPKNSNLLAYEKEFYAKIYYSDHPVDRYYSEILGMKFKNIEYIPLARFSKHPGVNDNAHLLGTWLTVQDFFFTEIEDAFRALNRELS